jgi:GWxTD domain-containing protein
MRRFRRSLPLVLTALVSIASLVSGVFGQDEKLTPKVREFLKLTAYIILPQERSLLEKLVTQRDQDVFMESFWKLRDPTPGTPQNEYRDEMVRRLQHVNKFYGRGTTREGWQTDRGRVYMILGEPASRQDFSGRRGIHPCEVWYYYGNKDKGLPNHFGLLFFKRKGIGELRLYDPVSDGITSLLMNSANMSFDDYPALYQRMHELVPDLAPITLSIVPGEIPYNFTPSPQETIRLADILESPQKDVNPSYATHFLDYKGIVSTEYMTNFIDSTACVDLILDPVTGLDILNFAISPKTLSLDYYQPKDQYFCDFQLNVSLRKGEEIVFQYSKDFPVYLTPAQAEGIRSSGLSIEDAFPVAEGQFKIVILLQNTVGKEFTIFEKEISNPGDTGRPRIVGPVAGYNLKSYDTHVRLPYKLGDKKLLTDPSATFSPAEQVSFLLSVSNVSEALWRGGAIKMSLKGLKPSNPYQKLQNIPLNGLPFRKVLPVIQTIPASELSPDYYELTVILDDENGAPLDEQKIHFIISATADTPHPVAQAKMIAMPNEAPFCFMLADQYQKTGRPERAEAMYRRGFELNPRNKGGLLAYARFLLTIKKYEACLGLVELLRGDEPSRHDYLSTKGRVLAETGRYGEAIELLSAANAIYDSDTTVLNSLGTCYFRTGQKEKALAALKASLRLNPEQAEIKILIAQIEK